MLAGEWSKSRPRMSIEQRKGVLICLAAVFSSTGY